MEWRQITNVGLALAGFALTAALISALWINRFDPVLTGLVLKNFPAIVGLPFAYIASFAVIALFRQGEATLEFKGFGFEFKGAAGEVVLWIASFCAIATAIKLMWRE